VSPTEFVKYIIGKSSSSVSEYAEVKVIPVLNYVPHHEDIYYT